MNYRKLAFAGLLAMAATGAFARVDLNIGIGVPGPVMVAPAPVYMPPPAYVVPRPVYTPRPVVVMPQQSVYAPGWRGYDDDRWERWDRGWRRHHHRHWRHGDDDDDD